MKLDRIHMHCLRSVYLQYLDTAFVYGTIKRLKGIWWMPWHAEAMKDVARCDKLRGGVSNL